MNSRSSDVQLVIRARDEAQKTIDAVSGALNKLFGIQNKVAGSAEETGANISQLATVLGSLDKAYTALAGGAERAETAFTRQKAAIAGQRQELQALQAQANAAQAALQRLNGADAIVSAGRDQSGRRTQIKVVASEYDRLSNQIEKLARSIATQEAGLNSSTSSLQKVSSTANAVEVAVAAARREIELQNRALREQAAAAQTAANVQRVTGTGRTAATDNGAGFEALAKREIQLQEQRAAAARTAAAAVAESVRQSTGIGSGRATDNGASFQALAAREEAAALKDAALAHKLFEDRVRHGGDTLAEAEREERAMADAAARLRAQLDPVADIEARLVAEQGKLNAMFSQGRISATELAAGMKLLRSNADSAIQAINGRNGRNGIDSRGRPTLFGLKPYELQNLGYQVNDVVTQLASGTSLSQTLAQQGGQLLQLFPRVGSAVAAALSNPLVLGFAVALGAVALGVSRIYDETQKLREFGAILSAGADGANYTAEALLDATKALDNYGLSAEKAVAVVRTLLKDGFDEQQIVRFGQAAQDMSKLLGIDVVDATKQLSVGLNGNFADLEKLNKAFRDAGVAGGLFTAEQLASIKASFDAGRADEARGRALDILAGKLGKAARDMEGPWARAARSFGEAWNNALDWLADSYWVQWAENWISIVGDVAEAAADATRKINNLTSSRGSRNGEVDERGVPFFDASVPQTAAGQQAAAAPVNSAQLEADRKLREEAEKRDALEGKITSQRAIQTRLAQKEKDLRAELDAADSQFKNASAAEKNRFISSQLERERLELNKQLADYLKQQADAAERVRKAAAAFPAQALELLKKFEGFQRTAKWDVNAFRVGFGSSTITNPDGSFREVKAGDTVTREAATRDLERRIQEFANVVKQQIGSERFAQFSASQQAALTSIAYNYGSLPERIIKAVKEGTNEQIATAVRGLAGDDKGINARRRNLEADILGAPNLAVDQGAQQAAADLQEKQDKFNQSLTDEAAARQRNIDAANAQRGLSGEALINTQREAEVQKAIAEAREKAAKDGLTFSKAQEEALREQVRLEFEATRGIEERAKARRDAVDDAVSDLTAQRDALQAQMTFQRDQGNNGAADALMPQLDSVNNKLREAIDNAIAFYQALRPGDDPLLDTQAKIDTLISKLQTARASTEEWGRILGITGRQIAETFKNTAVGALERFAQAVAEGKNVFSSLKNAFLTFAASFLQQIAKMIQQQIIFNLVASFLRTGGGGAAGGGGSGLSGGGFGTVTGYAHTGGVIGRTALLSKPVSPSWFGSATRYHSGGIAGLRPDEVPAILQRGEEVLTASDPRHRDNGGLGGEGQIIKIVNSFDADEAAQAILNSRSAEKAVLNLVTRNRRAFQDAISR